MAGTGRAALPVGSPSMSIPALSVALSVYNGGRYLSEAIASVRGQTFADFEFLILDDGSTDETAAIIARHAAEDPRIRPISRENRGLVASLNQLLHEARAPVIARMDADDRCHPERFARQLAFLAAHPDHGVVGCWNDHIDEAGRPCEIDGPDHATDHSGILAMIAAGLTPLSHPTVCYRRDVVQAVGGYHPAFRHCEDYDLWLRLASRTRLANLPERLLSYRRHEAQVSSRHVIEQTMGAAVARLAWREREAGRPDPTEQLDRLPPLAVLDTLFGRAGVGRGVRAEVVQALVYSEACASEAWLAFAAGHLRDGGVRTGLWRTAGRLVRLGQPRAALRLAGSLLAPVGSGISPV